MGFDLDKLISALIADVGIPADTPGKALEFLQEKAEEIASHLPEGSDIITPLTTQIVGMLSLELGPDVITNALGRLKSLMVPENWGEPDRGGGSIA